MTEYSPREPHIRKFANYASGQEAIYQVDDMGTVNITEELLEALLLEIGFVEDDSE